MRLATPRLLVALCVACGGAFASSARAQPAQDTAVAQHIRVRLVADHTAVRAGDTIHLGVRLEPEDGWHVYWKQAGDSGEAPQVRWTLPPDFRVGALQWPLPVEHYADPLLTIAYHGPVVLSVPVQVPFDLAGDTVTVEVKVGWLVCEDDQGCIPGEATLRRTLPVTHAAPPRDEKWAPVIAAARARVPAPAPESISLAVDATGAHVTFRGEGAWRSEAATFELLPETWDVVDTIGDPEILRSDDTVRVSFPASDRMAETPTHFTAVAVVEHAGQREGFVLRWGTAPDASSAPAPTPSKAAAAPVASESDGADDLSWAHAYVDYVPGQGAAQPPEDSTFLGALLLALLGGVILNIMPCVLPVLSLKVLGFVEQGGEDPVRARRHGYAYGAGVVMSFLAVAGVLLIVRALGNQVGWGFQMQEPAVIVGLAFLMFALALNLFGVFEIGLGVAGAAGRASDRVRSHGYLASFGTGALATVIATPCTAPFMGTAIGFAMGRSDVEALAVFGALGLGMAAPYVLLALFPRLLRFVPRPGPWMETFKQIMAFPLLATVVWLLWVYGRQVGTEGITGMLVGLLLASLGAWCLGRFGAARRPARSRWIGRALALALVVVGVVVALPASGDDSSDAVATAPEGWVPYDGHAIRAYQDAGTPVFLDFTADWCLTCKVNEATFLETDTVQAAFARHGVVAMQADWTRRDARITEALARLKRSSVPLYVIVPPDRTRPVVLLNTAITSGYVADALDEVLGGTPAVGD